MLTEAEMAEVDADGPDDVEEKGPLRRCLVTGTRAARETMLRFVLTPDGGLMADLKAGLPGRGMWLSARRDVIEAAMKRGAFARAARRQVPVPPTLLEDIEAGLSRRVRETLGLARRAGQAVSGFVKAREWVDTGRAGLIVQAHDGSPDERARFLGGPVIEGVVSGGRAVGVSVVTPLDAAALGTIFGRDGAVHVVVAPGRLAETLRIEAGRLAGVAGMA